MQHALLAMSPSLIAATFFVYAILFCIISAPVYVVFLAIKRYRLRTGNSIKSDAYRAAQAELHERRTATTEEARQQYQSAAQARRQNREQANAALDVPIVAYDRYGNPHVTTRRNQGFAAVLTVVFMIATFTWIYHGGFMHQDCTTTLTTSGGINGSTMHDVTTCK